MISKNILAAAALTACGTFSHAAQVGPYIGAGVGLATFNVDCTAGYNCDDSSTGFKLNGGYNFTHQWGVQVDYIDFGSASWTAYGTQVLKLTGSLFGASGVFNFDINKQWSGAAHLGLASVSMDGSGWASNGSQSTTKLYGGVDFAYAVNPKLKIRAGWDFSTGDYTDRFGEDMSGGVHLFSVGASYSF